MTGDFVKTQSGGNKQLIKPEASQQSDSFYLVHCQFLFVDGNILKR